MGSTVGVSEAGDVVVGKHLYANLYGVDPERAWDEDGLRAVVAEAARASNITLLEVRSWRLGGTEGRGLRHSTCS